MLGGILGVEIAAGGEVTRRPAEDLQVARGANVVGELRFGAAAHEGARQCIDARIRRERLPRRIRGRDEQIHDEQRTPEPRQRNRLEMPGQARGERGDLCG